MPENKTTKKVKTCENCIHNNAGMCKFIRENFLVMTRVLDKGRDVGHEYQLESAITITDAAKKFFCCNQWKEKEVKEEE